MFGLVVIEVMTPSGHLSNINEMGDFSNFVAFSQASKISIFVPILIGPKEKNSEFRIDQVKPLREDHTRL